MFGKKNNSSLSFVLMLVQRELDDICVAFLQWHFMLTKIGVISREFCEGYDDYDNKALYGEVSINTTARSKNACHKLCCEDQDCCEGASFNDDTFNCKLYSKVTSIPDQAGSKSIRKRSECTHLYVYFSIQYLLKAVASLFFVMFWQYWQQFQGPMHFGNKGKVLFALSAVPSRLWLCSDCNKNKDPFRPRDQHCLLWQQQRNRGMKTKTPTLQKRTKLNWRCFSLCSFDRHKNRGSSTAHNNHFIVWSH